MKRIYLVGLGAIGASFGSLFVKNNNKHFKVLLDQERFEKMQGKSVVVNGIGYRFDYVIPSKQLECADLIIIACKYNQLGSVLELIEPVVGPSTQILSLLNGITSEEIIAEKYGWERTIFGLCFGIDAIKINDEFKYGNIGKIIFGEKENTVKTERILAVESVFKDNGVPYEIPVDFLRIQWRKFMINVANNQTSAILMANYGVFHQVPEIVSLMVDVMREVILIANAKGIGLGEEDIETYLHLIKTFDPEGKTSTHQDLEAGRRTEVDMFAGVVRKLGDELGIETPLNDMIYKMIVTMEKMRGAR